MKKIIIILFLLLSLLVSATIPATLAQESNKISPETNAEERETLQGESTPVVIPEATQPTPLESLPVTETQASETIAKESDSNVEPEATEPIPLESILVTETQASETMTKESNSIAESEENNSSENLNQDELAANYYEQLLASKNFTEFEEIMNKMTQEEIEALTEEEIENLRQLVESFAIDEVLAQTIPFTAAGPFMPAVTVHSTARMMRGLRTLSADPLVPEGLVIDKSVTATGDGSYKIILESYTTGSVTTISKTVPADIVLVLDQSGSMTENFGNISRQAALQNSVKSFITSVGEKYDASTSDHRISLVTFAGGSDIRKGWTKVDATGSDSLKNSINNLPSPSGATNIAAGMVRAETLMTSGLDYTGSNTERQKVVVVFTDGVPTTSNTFSIGVADSAIKSAERLKDSGVTVYSIGIFDGANKDELWGSTGFNPNSNGTVGTTWKARSILGFGDIYKVDIPAGNRFLNYLSNNFMTATKIGLTRFSSNYIVYAEAGFKIDQNFNRTKSGYYLTASNANELNSIFTTIAGNIETPGIELGSEAVIKDIISPYFTLPQGAESDAVRIYTAQATATTLTNGDWQTKTPSGLTATISEKNISVTGFDFNDNFVAEDPRGDANNFYGKKLIIEITVKAEPDFFGGNGVPTNEKAEIYANETTTIALATFTEPIVNVPLNFDYSVTNQAIYLGNQVNLRQALDFKKTGDILYQPNGINNAYVDIEYSLLDDTNNLMGTYLIPRGTDMTDSNLHDHEFWTSSGQIRPLENKNYQVKVKLIPSIEGEIPAESQGPKNLGIQIYRPLIQAEDSQIYLGETINLKPLYTRANLEETEPVKVSLSWQADNRNLIVGEDYAGPFDQEPFIQFNKANKMDIPGQEQAYNLETFKPSQETPFQLLVELLPDSLMPVNSIALQELEETGKAYAALNSEFDFKVLLKYGSLTVEKTGNITDPNQSFIFQVTSNDGKTWELVIQSNSSKTITGLAIGNYTVKEQTDWSWRYEPDTTTKSAELKANDNEDHASLSFNNTRINAKWLSGDSYIENIFNPID